MSFASFARKRPILSFYLLTYVISWGAAGGILVGLQLGGVGVSATTGGLLFPVLILGPFVSGLVHVRLVDGREGWRRLKARFGAWHGGAKWAVVAALLIPSVLLLLLESLRSYVSPVFAPHFWWLGFTLGVPPGILEEVGWTGFVFPRMAARYDARRAALLMGPLWGIWHAPAVDYLGAAYPHGADWVPFFLAFLGVLCAARVLIAWVFTNTGSLSATQIMHLSLTGTLVFLDPVGVTPAQEAAWYGLAAAVLGIAALSVLWSAGPQLLTPRGPSDSGAGGDPRR